MQPKLKENPREWLKFTAVMALLVTVLSFLLVRRAFPVIVGIAAVALIVCALRPRLFRGFYRGGTAISFYIGQVMGRILLTVFFILVVTPLGLLLRLSGKDLLQLKRPSGASSYWRPAKTSNQFDRMF
jgi:Saxitoxin biosynthesis operon protein SxtJ